MYIGRFFLIPGDKLVCITGLVGNVPEEKAGFIADGPDQIVYVLFSIDPG